MKLTKTITVNDRMQKNYIYILSENPGENFNPIFTPHFEPSQMLKLGIFEGKYCTDCINEFPQSWFSNAKISSVADPKFNYFGVKSRQSLSVWREKGWIYDPDPRGWFQWYCRYFIGRRLPDLDMIQINRWKNFSRHASQVLKNCNSGDLSCRPRQRQALLQWSYDPFI